MLKPILETKPARDSAGQIQSLREEIEMSARARGSVVPGYESSLFPLSNGSRTVAENYNQPHLTLLAFVSLLFFLTAEEKKA